MRWQMAVVLASVVVPATASPPYTLRPGLEIVLGVSGGAAMGGGLLFRSLAIPPTYPPDSSMIPGPDCWLMAPLNSGVDLASDITLAAAIAAPAAMLLGRDIEGVVTILVMYAETMALAQGVKETLKGALPRYRPYAYDGVPSPDTPSDRYASFPSGHTTVAFASATFLASLLSAYHGQAKWRAAATIGVLFLAGSTGVLRIAAGQHFLTDVLAGAGIGSFIGVVVPLLHRATKGVTDVGRTAVRFSVAFR